MTEQPFKQIDVWHRVPGGTMVTWTINPLFSAPQPWAFKLYASRSGVGDWVLVAEVENSYYAYDTERHIYGVSPRLSYFVELTDGDGSHWPSFVKLAAGNLTQQDWATAKEIIRKEVLLLGQYSGVCGYLWKRRHWGTKCPDCTDFDTGQVTNSQCETCYGTGLVGGYFDPVEYTAAFVKAPHDRNIKVEDQSGVGTTENQVHHLRGLVCPWIDTNDVWGRSDTDERWIVRTVAAIEYRGVPIVYYPIEVFLAPSTDIVYKLPRPGESGDSSSSS